VRLSGGSSTKFEDCVFWIPPFKKDEIVDFTCGNEATRRECAIACEKARMAKEEEDRDSRKMHERSAAASYKSEASSLSSRVQPQLVDVSSWWEKLDDVSKSKYAREVSAPTGMPGAWIPEFARQHHLTGGGSGSDPMRGGQLQLYDPRQSGYGNSGSLQSGNQWSPENLRRQYEYDTYLRNRTNSPGRGRPGFDSRARHGNGGGDRHRDRDGRERKEAKEERHKRHAWQKRERRHYDRHAGGNPIKSRGSSSGSDSSDGSHRDNLESLRYGSKSTRDGDERKEDELSRGRERTRHGYPSPQNKGAEKEDSCVSSDDCSDDTCSESDDVPHALISGGGITSSGSKR